jgi:hypothetical protein
MSGKFKVGDKLVDPNYPSHTARVVSSDGKHFDIRVDEEDIYYRGINEDATRWVLCSQTITYDAVKDVVVGPWDEDCEQRRLVLEMLGSVAPEGIFEPARGIDRSQPNLCIYSEHMNQALRTSSAATHTPEEFLSRWTTLDKEHDSDKQEEVAEIVDRALEVLDEIAAKRDARSAREKSDDLARSMLAASRIDTQAELIAEVRASEEYHWRESRTDHQADWGWKQFVTDSIDGRELSIEEIIERKNQEMAKERGE